MKILIVYNPVAGKKNNFEKKLQKMLGDIDYDWTSILEDYENVIKSKQYNRIIGVGGDGTVYRLANVILKNNLDTALGIIPTGSANLLARSFNIPKNIGLALHLALHGEPKKIDVGRINHEYYFTAAAGIGYDAYAVQNTKTTWKKIFGLWAYTVALAEGLVHFRETNFSLNIDGVRRSVHAKTIFLMNVGNFLGLEFGPNIKANDGKLNMAIVRPVQFGDYFKIFGRLLGKKFHWEKRLEYHAFSKLQINYDKRHPVQVDGEYLDIGSPIEVEVLREKLNIVCGK